MLGYDYHIITIIFFIVALLTPGCKCRDTHGCSTTNELPKMMAPVKSQEDSQDYFDYTPKATFTTVESMVAQIPEEMNDDYLGLVNCKYLDGCYYTGDTSTPFLASFAERWNKSEFLRRFVNAEELFERENTCFDDSLSMETVKGTMPLLPDEYQLAFRDGESQAKAKKLVRMLTTIDYVPEQTDKMAEDFKALVKVPYETPEFITSKEMKEMKENFWTLYDKSQYVADYADIMNKRMSDDVKEDYLEKQSIPLQHRYVEEESFDAKCIYALELGCYNYPDAVDYLGELIEDGRYSKYLFEVWVNWRLLSQSSAFGVSTWSEIPDNLYDNARLLVAKAYVRHIMEDPSDTLAKLLLLNITFTENLHRAGCYYGNEALGVPLLLRRRLFLPDSIADKKQTGL